MVKRVEGVISLLFFLAAHVFLAASADAAAPGAAEEAPAARNLAADPRLNAAVSPEFSDTPLREVLAVLSRRSKASITASREVADEKVTLLAAQTTVRQVMQQVSRHFDFQWYRSGDGYLLAQDAASRAREAAAREAAVEELWQRSLSELREIERIAGMPRDALERRRDELTFALSNRELGPTDRARVQAELSAVRSALDPAAGISAALMGALSPTQLQQLRAGGELRLGTGSGTLPPAIADRIHQASSAPPAGAGFRAEIGERRELRLGVPGAPGGEENLPILGADAVIRFRANPPAGMRGPAQGALTFTLTSTRGDANRRSSRPLIWSPRSGVNPVARPVQSTQTDDPELLKEVDLGLNAADPAQRQAPLLVAGPGAAWRPGMACLSAVLAALRRQSGLEILSDSYVRARIDPVRLAGRRRVVEILDLLATELDYRWSKGNSQLSLRSKIYFHDRPAEAPDRLLEPWKTRVARRPAPTLDDYSDLAAAMTDPQCMSLQRYWGWYLEGPAPVPAIMTEFYGNRHHLRFWATLSAGQRRAALAGQILPVQQMNAVQQRALAIAATAPPDGELFAYKAAGASISGRPLGGFRLNRSEGRMMSLASGDGAGGQERQALVFGLSQTIRSGPPGVAPPPPVEPPVLPRVLGPNQEELVFRSAETRILDSYLFQYLAAEEPVPVRTANLSMPRAPDAQGGQRPPAPGR